MYRIRINSQPRSAFTEEIPVPRPVEQAPTLKMRTQRRTWRRPKSANESNSNGRSVERFAKRTRPRSPQLANRSRRHSRRKPTSLSSLRPTSCFHRTRKAVFRWLLSNAGTGSTSKARSRPQVTTPTRLCSRSREYLAS